jgi:hypothetical protein
MLFSSIRQSGEGPFNRYRQRSVCDPVIESIYSVEKELSLRPTKNTYRSNRYWLGERRSVAVGAPVAFSEFIAQSPR